ncbi:MAG: hypothetical protein FJX70_00245 [Alphaproteobacteria bacterium]|nr:hypothetical protein [Alphaproteobacteria bacterium]
MKTNSYNQNHLELIKIHEEHNASLKQIASDDIEAAKKSAAESIASYIRIWEGYYKEFYPEQWQTKLEEEKQKIENELKDKIDRINQELENQIQLAYTQHEKNIQEVEQFQESSLKLQESLLDIEINNQIPLAGGQKTFFVKTFLSQINSWGRFDKDTEAYIEKQLGDYAKKIGNWKDLGVVTEYVVKNCPKELESIFTKQLLTDEEEATAFTHLKKYGYQFMSKHGPLLSFDSSEKIAPTIKKLLSYSYIDQPPGLTRDTLKNKLIRDLTKIIKVDPSIKLLLNVSPQYGNIYIYGKKLTEIIEQGLEQDFDGYYEKAPSKKVGYIVVSKASSYIEDMASDFVDVFIHEHVHQAMQILFDNFCKPYKAVDQLAQASFSQVMRFVKESHFSRMEALKAKVTTLDLSEGNLLLFDQMEINGDTIIKLSLAQTKDIKKLLQDIFTQSAKDIGDKSPEGSVSNIISIIDPYVNNDELLLTQGKSVLDNFSKTLSGFFPSLKECSIELILSYLIDIEEITPGPFYFLSRYPEEAWDSEAIAHYFEHVAAVIRDPSSKTKLAAWKATGIDKYFTEHILSPAVEYLTPKFLANNDENRELAKNLLAPSWNSEEVDALFNTAHSVSILGGELVEAAF